MDGQPQGRLSWPSEKVDVWHGFQRHHFTVDGCDCWVVEPKQAAAGNPWTCCLENPDAFVERTGVPQLLEKGFYHLYCSGGDTCGNPESMKHYIFLFIRIDKDPFLGIK